MEFKKLPDAEGNTENAYLSQLESKMNCGKSNGNDKFIINIELDGSENLTTVSVSTPLSCGFIPDCISEETCKNRLYHVSVNDGLLTTSVNLMRHKDGALDDLLEIISSMMAKTASMKLALEVINNG